ncbi:hypothetical protein B0H17DRAFT_1131799 [Mycena rosella]|uniref:DUF6532 domain-containing protein n=1 Tax=Mycena rosella TaxID=1033263 RepID=A0AAD7GH91_MYCRO|nr:hypothetical protein B0H17DRAFT_1131799 [Mycena rosella]
MAKRVRPKPRALEDEGSDSGPFNGFPSEAATAQEQQPFKRPSRKAKDQAMGNAIWNGAAPKGPKPKDSSTTQDTTPASRKRAASTTQQSGRNTKTHQGSDHDMSDVEDALPAPKLRELPAVLKRKTRKVVDESETEQPSVRALEKRSKAKPHKPTLIQEPDEAFADDEEDAQSESGMAGVDGDGDEEEEENNFNDLQGLNADELERRLADEKPRWDDEDEDEEASILVDLPSSVPESHIDLVSDSSNSDDDPAARAAFSSIKAGYDRAPAPQVLPIRKPAPKRRDTSPGPSSHRSEPKTISAPRGRSPEQKLPKLDLTRVCRSFTVMKAQLKVVQIRRRATDSGKGPGKHDLQRAQERPEWNNEASMSRGRSHSGRPSTKIKREPQEPGLSHSIKTEADDTNSGKAEGDNSIEIRFNSRNAMGLKDQRPPVTRTAQLGIEYYLGLHLIKGAYPDLQNKTEYGADALDRAARDLAYPAIRARLLNDQNYRDALVTVLSGRISTFRGAVKTTAGSIIFHHYGVQQDCADLVARLLAGQSYIYPHKPDKIDLRTNATIPGKPDAKKPYEHEGIPAVASTFFKGNNPIAERITAMFVKNDAGNFEATPPMVAISCAGLHSVIDDHSSGEHKPTNFDGGRVQDIYDLHIMLLEKLKAKHPQQYRATMENIFTVASRGSSFAKGPKAPLTLLQKEALAMLKFSD